MSYGNVYTAPRYDYMQHSNGVVTATYASYTPSSYVGSNAFGVYSGYGNSAKYGYGCVSENRLLYVAFTILGAFATPQYNLRHSYLYRSIQECSYMHDCQSETVQ